MTKDQMAKVQIIEVTAVKKFQRHPVILHVLGYASYGSFETVDL